MAAEAASD